MINERLFAVCIIHRRLLASVILVFVDVIGGVTPRELALSYLVTPQASMDVVEWILLLGDDYHCCRLKAYRDKIDGRRHPPDQ